MSQNANKPAAEWLNYSARVELRALHLERDGLKRLYAIIAAKQQETKSFYMQQLALQPEESDENFALRQQRVNDSFVVSVTIHGFNQKLFTGNHVDIFENPNLPDKIRSVFYSTESVPAAVLNLKASEKIVVFLDFSRPPLLDLGRVPTWPTPNESNFSVDGTNNSWCSAATAELSEFFDDRYTRHNWLHAAGLYDILMVTVGIPFALSAANKATLIAKPLMDRPLLFNAVCVYAFLLGIASYRIIFTYARWVYPKIEITGKSSSVGHRVAIYGLSLGIITNIVYDLGKAILF